jgi:hypothetical protein
MFALSCSLKFLRRFNLRKTFWTPKCYFANAGPKIEDDPLDFSLKETPNAKKVLDQGI